MDHPGQAAIANAMRDLAMAASRPADEAMEVGEQNILDWIESAQAWLDQARDDVSSQIRFRKALAECRARNSAACFPPDQQRQRPRPP